MGQEPPTRRDGEAPEWTNSWWLQTVVPKVLRYCLTLFFTWLGYQLFAVELERVRAGEPLDLYLFFGSLILMGFLPADLVTFVIKRFFGANGNGGK